MNIEVLSNPSPAPRLQMWSHHLVETVEERGMKRKYPTDATEDFPHVAKSLASSSHAQDTVIQEHPTNSTLTSSNMSANTTAGPKGKALSWLPPL